VFFDNKPPALFLRTTAVNYSLFEMISYGKAYRFLAHFINTLIQNVRNLFLDKQSKVYTGAIPEA